MVRDFNAYDDANDGKDDEEYNEANPALSACRSCRGDSFFRVAETTDSDETQGCQKIEEYSPSFDILFNLGCLSLDSVYGLILLLNKDTHLTCQGIVRQPIT